MGFREHVGVLPIAPTQIVLAVQVEAPQILQLDAAAKDVGRRGQAVLKADGLQIGDVLDIALGLRDEQQDLLAVEIDLAVRGHPDLVVVAQRQQEFDLGDFVLGKTGPIDKIRAIEIVHQPHLLRPVGGDKTLLQEAALDDRLKANGLARFLRAIAIGDLHVRRIGKKRCAAHAVFGRIVAQHELDQRDSFVLPDGQRSSEWVASLLVEQGMRLVGIGRVQRNFGKVAELGSHPPTRQDGVVRPQHLAISGRATAGVAQPRKQKGCFVAVGSQIELHAVHTGLGKHHRRQHRAQAAARRQGVEVLALVVLRHHNFGKPALKTGGLKQHVAELLGLALRVVENQPAAREEIAVQIVEVIALQSRFHVALIRVARIVGVFPLPPMVLAV